MNDLTNWKHDVDMIASYWAASRNKEQPVYWLERAFKEKEYHLKFSDGTHQVSLSELLNECPEITSFLANKGWTLSNETSNIKEIVLNALNDGSWTVYRFPDEKKITSLKYRPTDLLWSFNEELRTLYWKNVVNKKNFGRQVDSWARVLKKLLNEPMNPKSRTKFAKRIKNMMFHQPNWEEESGQSIQAWAYQSPSWEKELKKWGFSFQGKNDGIPLILWAIENNWTYGIQSWMKETQLELSYVPPFEHIPSYWFGQEKNDELSGSLWHWMCRISDLSVYCDILAENHSLPLLLDNHKRNGLHWACNVAHIKNINILLEYGVSLNQEDRDGKIPSEMVPDGFDPLFAFLEDYRLSKNIKKLFN